MEFGFYRTSSATCDWFGNTSVSLPSQSALHIYIHTQGNRRYQTLPALCTAITLFPADRPYRLRSEFSGFLFAINCVAYWMIPSPAWCYRQLNNPFCSERIVSGEETPIIASPRWDFVTLPEEERATAIGNILKNGKDRACGSGDMLADRQTDSQTHRHTQTCSLQYFATAPAGDVKIMA